MKKLQIALLTFLGYHLTTVAGCATVAPYVVPVVTCSTETIPPQDVKDAIGDLFAGNWADLERLGKKDGYPDLACILDQAVAANPSLKGKAGEFKSLHAVEFRAAGVSAENITETATILIAGAPEPSPCSKACGDEDFIATGSRCLCWVGKGKSGHWVEASKTHERG